MTVGQAAPFLVSEADEEVKSMTLTRTVYPRGEADEKRGHRTRSRLHHGTHRTGGVAALWTQGAEVVEAVAQEAEAEVAAAPPNTEGLPGLLRRRAVAGCGAHAHPAPMA